MAVQLHPQHADYSDLRKAVTEAEELGIDVVYNWDHFYPLYGDPDGKHFECWTMLGAWAEQTTSVEIGALVTCNSYRNPQLLADMARTVDHMSGGRLILGIGSGWFQRDYDEFGYEFGTAPSRLRDLDANMPLIAERLNKGNPAPLRKIPVLIGGGGEKVTLRITAEHADIWHFFGTPEQMGRKAGILDGWCAKVGRDPAEIERSTQVEYDEIEGDPIEFAEQYYALGFTQFVFGLNGPDYDMTPVKAWLEWRDSKNA
ncbi:MAG: LLM class F420-dependent oxidoreductase [bacterium]|nr:LLM class F420-dependent oxidoreductase [bacterium]